MQRLIADIKNSAQSYGSIPFWSWNDKLNPEELRRQIRNMKDLKMNGFFMHARGGLETAYLSDDWYACVEACIDEAKKAGMEAWAYDENGWPSGFAGGKLLKNENYYGSYLKYETASAYPADAQDPAAHILGVYVLKDNRICRIAEADPAAEAEAKAAADSGAQPVYHIIRQGFDTSYVDTLDPAITREFLEITRITVRIQGKTSAVLCRAFLPMNHNITAMPRPGQRYFPAHFVKNTDMIFFPPFLPCLLTLMVQRNSVMIIICSVISCLSTIS